jgi:hypothetical protein
VEGLGGYSSGLGKPQTAFILTRWHSPRGLRQRDHLSKLSDLSSKYDTDYEPFAQIDMGVSRNGIKTSISATRNRIIRPHNAHAPRLFRLDNVRWRDRPRALGGNRRERAPCSMLDPKRGREDVRPPHLSHASLRHSQRADASHRFSVYWRDHDNYVDTCSFIDLDGFVVPGRFLFGTGVAFRSGVRTGTATERPFTFATVEEAGEHSNSQLNIFQKTHATHQKKTRRVSGIPEQPMWG